MSDKPEVSNLNSTSFHLVPFTGGAMAIYAFFWPEQYGQWLGTIVRAFRAASGI